MRVALAIAYDGTALSGWQRQADRPTVQGALEKALGKVADAPVTLAAAGRTDAGVHATGQVAHFDSPTLRPLRAWVAGTNRYLPSSVRVRWAREVESAFDARRSATARRYVYLFADEASALPLYASHCWLGAPLDAAAMHRAAQHFLGERDFSAVRAAGCQSRSAMRFVQRLVVHRVGAFVYLDVTANAFLLHMVRNIASALREVGLGRQDEQWISTLLDGRDRRNLGPTAPAQGLSLVDVVYPAAVAPALPQPTGLAPPLLGSLTTLDRL